MYSNYTIIVTLRGKINIYSDYTIIFFILWTNKLLLTTPLSFNTRQRKLDFDYKIMILL